MATYTVRVERQDPATLHWHTEIPDTVTSDPRGPQELSDQLALMETVADGHTWRVRVWRGDRIRNPIPDAEHCLTRSMGLGQE